MLSNVRSFFLSFFISLLLFGVIAFGVLSVIGVNTGVGGDTTPVFNGGDDYVDNSDPASRADELDGTSFNMLFVGLDYAPSLFYDEYDPSTVGGLVAYGDPDAGAGSAISDGEYRRISADTILLLCISKENKQFAFTAISPNTLIESGGETKCLGDIFEDDGLESFIGAVHTLCGVPIDRYALVDLANFAEVVDIIDGVDFNVPCDMKYDDNNGKLHIDITSGYQHLDGKTALEMLRFNKYEDTTSSRLKTTMAFARAIAAKITDSKYITKALALFREAEKLIVTDFSASDLNSNLDLIFSYPNYEALSIDLPGTYSTIDGKLCFIPNLGGCVSTLAPYQRNS